MDDIAELQKKIEAQRLKKSRADADCAAAQERLAETEAFLKKEFSVTPAGATKLLRKLEADLEAEAARVRESLEKAGG